jgi:hypothetical protein
MANAMKITFAGVIIIGAILFILFLNSTTKKETEVKIAGETFEITGSYGKLFNFKDVTSIELKDTLPTIGRKTNGAGLGEVKKGYFELDGMGNSLLFINANKGPFLYIKAGDTQIIMNYIDGEKTKKLYQDMKTRWKK